MSSGSVANYQGAAFGPPYEVVEGPQGQKYLRIYNDTGSALSNGAIKMLSFEVDATDTSNPIIKAILKAPATGTLQTICVVDNSPKGLATIPDGEWGFVCVQGYCKALCNGATDIAVGDQLEVLTTGTAFIVAGAATVGDAGTILPEASAIALEAYTTGSDALKMVSLIGGPRTVAAA